MRISREIDFNYLMDECWSGAIDTLSTEHWLQIPGH